ncbi:MAG: VOC family protein [Pelodictyon phaeoclathratiforme]
MASPAGRLLRPNNTRELSPCFVTKDVDACRDFYQRHFSAKAIFDCGWYLNMHIGGDGPSIQFMQPQEGMVEYGAEGVMLNFRVDDVDAEYARLVSEGVTLAMPLEDHPWGDRGFSIIDPIGTALYIYSDREPSDEFRQYYTS